MFRFILSNLMFYLCNHDERKPVENGGKKLPFDMTLLFPSLEGTVLLVFCFAPMHLVGLEIVLDAFRLKSTPKTKW